MRNKETTVEVKVLPNVTAAEVITDLRSAKKKLGEAPKAAGARAAMAKAIRFLLWQGTLQKAVTDVGSHKLAMFERFLKRWVDPAWVGFLCWWELREYLLARGWQVDETEHWRNPGFPGYSGDIRAVMARETAVVKGRPDPNWPKDDVEDLVRRIRPVLLKAINGEVPGLLIEASGRGADAIKIRLGYRPISLRLVNGFGPELDGRVELFVDNESAADLAKLLEAEHKKAVANG